MLSVTNKKDQHSECRSMLIELYDNDLKLIIDIDFCDNFSTPLSRKALALLF